MGEAAGAIGMSPDHDKAPAGPQDTDELRREIEHTREELGETVEALAHKADVKGQAREKVEEVKASAGGKKDELLGRARQVTPGSAQEGAQSAVHVAREHPVQLGYLGVFVAGLVVGRLLSRR